MTDYPPEFDDDWADFMALEALAHQEQLNRREQDECRDSIKDTSGTESPEGPNQ